MGQPIQKYALFVLTIVLLAGFVPVQFVFAQTISADDLQKTIQALQVQIEALKVQITELQQELQVVKEELKFTRTLSRGIQGDEVKQLQEFLKTIPDVYPEGLVTGYFGPLTEAAVKRFQAKQGIETIGVVGPKTIAKLNEVTSAVPATPATPGETSAEPAQPAQPLLPAPAEEVSSGPSITATTTPTSSSATPAVPATPAAPAAPATPATSSSPAAPAAPAAPATPATPVEPAAPASCTESWSCGDWSACSSSGTQTRTCADSNSCGTTANKPATTQSCTPSATSCIENWSCIDWSVCSTSGTQSRLCSDLNHCNITTNKPTERQSCTQTEVASETPTPYPNMSPMCVDSDGGLNYYSAGYVSTTDPLSSKQIYDACIVQQLQDGLLRRTTTCSPSDGNCHIEEVYCDGIIRYTGDYGYSYKTVQCPGGCANRACVFASSTTACTESWSCGDWSSCSSSGSQTRTCTDSNSCGTTANKPAVSQGCTPPASSATETGSTTTETTSPTGFDAVRQRVVASVLEAFQGVLRNLWGLIR